MVKKVTFTTTQGEIEIELDEQKAPNTVENFLAYAKEGFYNGTIFHRVIKGFMIQGGGFDEKMQQKTGKAPIQHEGGALKNERYTLAMARTSDPHSASSQFFINVVNNDFLNHTDKTPQGWGYCVFGKVVQGMDVVDQIKAVATTNKNGHQDVPQENIVIQNTVVDEQA